MRKNGNSASDGAGSLVSRGFAAWIARGYEPINAEKLESIARKRGETSSR